MASVDTSVRNSLNSLNNLAGKISPQSNNTDTSSLLPVTITNGIEVIQQNGSAMNQREPDADAIKMFVGQVPRALDENDLRKMFEEFGEVFQINVLRDKITSQSKGCCFVTFYTRKAALEAQNALHNIKTMPGMHHPIQMKPADTENRNERKLFIGMLTKRYNEPEVRTLFSSFGTIEECTVLRDANGQSKGCAFVTFSSRQCAINAIKKMHHSQTMEGCSSPVVVKFADTQKEKDAKKIQSNLWNISSSPTNITTLGPQYLALLQQQQQLGSSNGATSTLANSLANSIPQISTLNNLSVQQLLGSAQGTLSQQLFDSPSLGNLNSLGNINLTTSTNGTQESNLHGLLATMASQNTGFGVNVQNLAALAAMTNNSNSSLQALTQPVLAGLTSSNSFRNALPSLSCSASASITAGKQVEGPEGANLFIYHLPQEFTDQELAQTFWPYGKVLSAKVFIDKQTNLSKCFGFVSYDNALDAQRAIHHMNGHQIGSKRLKVQLKRSKNDSKPY